MNRRDSSYACNSAKDFWKASFQEAYQRDKLPRDLTPLRYPGGKGSLKYFLANIVHANERTGGTLIEPFCGGAGASIPLLVTGVVSRLYLNDANPAIAAFWDSVFNDTDALISLIASTPVTIGQWYRWKEVINCPDEASTLELGFAAFFMNRCNRSGLLSGGPIGGLDQTGNYKIDCRFNRKALIERVEIIGAHRENVVVTCDDACDFLRSRDASVVDDALIFLDPPYVVQGRNLYKTNVFDESKHRELAEFIKRQAWHWVITYDDHPLIHSLYSERTMGVLELSYLMQQAKIGRELLVASSLCRIPLPPSLSDQEQTEVPAQGEGPAALEA